jgi:cation diffusion facilitator CzcD-associated flavoprotein CzcO
VKEMTMNDKTNVLDKVIIIGAGPAGLSTARALQLLDIPFVIYEKHKNVGGIWDLTNQGSPMYRSAHFISSKTMSGHTGFPMPEHYPDYPSNKQIFEYIKSFAQHYDLLGHIRFESTISAVSKSLSEDGKDQWQVSGRHAQGSDFSDTAHWLVCASGTNWVKNQPKLKGQDDFIGEIMHAVDYQDPASLKGKKVLVVGAGNSGVDIACDAAFSADEAYISFRRGYHFVPKHIFGMPADVFGAQSDWMPMRLAQIVFGGLLRLINGDLQRLGLQKPDHKVLSSHPILNSQLLHYIQHGDIQAMSDIERLEGSTAFFKDGRSIDVDKIILATGYDWKLPYLPDAFFEWKSNRPQTFMKVFNRSHPSLFINGYIETNGGAYKLFDDMAYLIARTIETQRNGEQSKQQAVEQFINGPEPDLTGKLSYVASNRHEGYTNSKAYNKAMKLMRSKLGWPDYDDAFIKSHFVKNPEAASDLSSTQERASKAVA